MTNKQYDKWAKESFRSDRASTQFDRSICYAFGDKLSYLSYLNVDREDNGETGQIPRLI